MRRIRSFAESLNRLALRPMARVTGDILGLVPALLAGAGVFLVVAGLFYYLQPASAATYATPTSTPGATGSIAPYSLPPIVSAQPSGSGKVQAAVATRIQVPALDIDLPIIQGPLNEEFPLCDTAEYLSLNNTAYAYPGLPQATYLYAHARTNMFLPLLTTSEVNDGASMIGMWAEVYTDDDQRHIYEITQVRRHVSGSASLDEPLAAKTDELWLQTSEGPYESSTKLQVVAQPIGVLAATQADAHPPQTGNVCPKAPVCKVAGDSGCTPAS